jgi:hypothetical protein
VVDKSQDVMAAELVELPVAKRTPVDRQVEGRGFRT